MTDRADRLGASRDGRRPDWRVLAALLIVALLVFAGAGVGMLDFPGGFGDDDETAVRTTPATATPTSAGSSSGTAEPTPSPAVPASPTRTEATVSSTPRRLEPGDPVSRDASLDLRVRGSAVFAELAAVEPGDAGESSVRFANAGDRPGRLLVSELTVTDDENGLLGPERAAGDDAVTGELSDALLVRLWASAPDGTRTYLYGSPVAYVPLGGLTGADASTGPHLAGGDQATVTLGWTLPAETGNRVQSDRVEMELSFALRSRTG